MARLRRRDTVLEDEPIYGDASLYGRVIGRPAEEGPIDFDPALAAVEAPERKPARRRKAGTPPDAIRFALVT